MVCTKPAMHPTSISSPRAFDPQVFPLFARWNRAEEQKLSSDEAGREDILAPLREFAARIDQEAAESASALRSPCDQLRETSST